MATHKEHGVWLGPGLGWRRDRHAPRCSPREGNFPLYTVIFLTHTMEQTCSSPGKSPLLLRGHIATDSWGPFLRNKCQSYLEACASPKSRTLLWDPHKKERKRSPLWVVLLAWAKQRERRARLEEPTDCDKSKPLQGLNNVLETAKNLPCCMEKMRHGFKSTKSGSHWSVPRRNERAGRRKRGEESQLLLASRFCPWKIIAC